MTLLINLNADYDTGWYSYDYIINHTVLDGNRGVIAKNVGEWNWESVGEVDFIFEGNEMHFAIPRDLIGLADENDLIFDFK